MDHSLRERLDRVQARLRGIRARTRRPGWGPVQPDIPNKVPTVSLREIEEIEGLAPTSQKEGGS